jgi:outer membrane protein assembly factor BamB
MPNVSLKCASCQLSRLAKSLCLFTVLNYLAIGAASAAGPSVAAWPQFRGPNGSGVAVQAKPPVRIGPTNGALWNIEVPWSPSSPSVWGDQIFLTTFVEDQLQTRCYARSSGALAWTQSVKPNNVEMFHRTENSPASATPATDGQHVVSYFGSFGVICHDLSGRELWRHPLPVALSGGGYGSGTSPTIVGKRVIMNRDQDQNSSLLALDLETGKTVWETGRPDATGSFGTPIFWSNDGVDQIVMPGSIRLKGYDLKTGSEAWSVEGVTTFACTTPVVGEGLVFFAGWAPGKTDAPWPSWNAFLEQYDKNKDGEVSLDEFDPGERDFMRGLDANHDGKITKSDWDTVMAHNAKGQNVVVAIEPGGRGDISQTHVAWKFNRGLPYVASPLYYQSRLYLIRDGGMLSSFDAKTGQPYYLQERLEAGGSYYASPVAADGRIYLVSAAGKLTVIKAGGDRPEILHQTDFGDRVFATPALVEGNLYLRTHGRLYAFGDDIAAQEAR